MTLRKSNRWRKVIVLSLAALVVFAALFQVGVRVLKRQVEQALGANSEVADIRVGWGAVEVTGLKLKGRKGWPATDTLRADRILIAPDLLSLFSDRIRISSITVDGAYLSALRTPDGRLRVVPSLLASPRQGSSTESTTKVHLGRIELRNAALEFFDASVKRPPLKIRLEKLDATVDNIDLPELDSRTQIDLAGVLKGRHRDGQVVIKGWTVLANLDSAITSRFRDVDLTALQPYLIKAADTGVRRGSLDLDLDSHVEHKHLRAPGTVTLRNLELDAGTNFMGFARKTAVATLKAQKSEMTIHFVLEGNLDDPTFSINENLATRFGSALAETLGLSVEGVATGVGGLSQKSLQAAGGAASGLGNAVKNLFGK